MKTAQTCITNAENIIAEFADKLTDEGRADLAAVVAMAESEAFTISLQTIDLRDLPRIDERAMELAAKVNAALAAAGVEVKA